MNKLFAKHLLIDAVIYSIVFALFYFEQTRDGALNLVYFFAVLAAIAGVIVFTIKDASIKTVERWKKRTNLHKNYAIYSSLIECVILVYFGLWFSAIGFFLQLLALQKIKSESEED